MPKAIIDRLDRLGLTRRDTKPAQRRFARPPAKSKFPAISLFSPPKLPDARGRCRKIIHIDMDCFYAAVEMFEILLREAFPRGGQSVRSLGAGVRFSDVDDPGDVRQGESDFCHFDHLLNQGAEIRGKPSSPPLGKDPKIRHRPQMGDH